MDSEFRRPNSIYNRVDSTGGLSDIRDNKAAIQNLNVRKKTEVRTKRWQIKIDSVGMTVNIIRG